MPRVNNVDDARMEITALQKERSLLGRLRALVVEELQRLVASEGHSHPTHYQLKDSPHR